MSELGNFPNCPEGYRPVTFGEMQEIMSQALKLAKLKADLAAVEGEYRMKASEIDSIERAVAATNARLGIEGAQGDILEGPGYAYLCVDRSKRIPALSKG